jgi:C1A family cysteine protease
VQPHANRTRWLASGLVLAVLLSLTSEARADVRDRAFDWTKRGVNLPVRKQGKQDCWAVAATSALEANWTLRHRKQVTLSPQPILDRTQQTGGDRVARALNILQNNGTAPESTYPYTRSPAKLRSVATPYRIAKWGWVDSKTRPSVANIKSALVAHGPLAAGVLLTDKFHKYKGGIFSENINMKDPNKMDHFVLIVGWDDAQRVWKIKNSWGTTWGEKGYMRIAYNSNNIGTSAAWVECQR